MSKCGFDEAWIGPCTIENPCEKHQDKKCSSCDSPATRSCDETGQFVCGAPLCNDCEHTICENGTNGGVGFYRSSPLPEGLKTHCKIVDQVYQLL